MNVGFHLTKNILIAAFLILQMPNKSAFADAAVEPLLNCRLLAPPAASGEAKVHGNLIKVFPRKAEMGDAYSGCQTVWGEDNGQWFQIMVGIFEQGKLTRMRVPSRPGDPIELCLQKNGELVAGDADVCSDMEVFPYSSAPPGCSTKQSGNKKELPECHFD
ncbi:hypothetical protein [Duganella sp.]|uniref:hypothetical protein n=1 Tax=Duganella sp. TaxID=1904440 RepID=UPI0031DD9EB1